RTYKVYENSYRNLTKKLANTLKIIYIHIIFLQIYLFLRLNSLLMKNSLRTLFAFSLTIFLFVSCMDDMDDVLPENRDMLQASEFVYRAMNFFYLYKANTPELANDYFSNDREKTDFISDFQSPEDLFHHLKYGGDRFSVLVDDYVELERMLQGKNFSTGAIFFSFTHGEDFYLLVRNVVENSSADENKVVRGDVFHKINGQKITENNVNELL